MKSVCIIPARGGSKRIPRKNIREFCGRPILEYSISAAIDSRIFDKVMVSTDDVEISALAKKAGAEVPFLRSKTNSSDFATTAQVIYEVLEQFKNLGSEFDYVCCLYPTAPFVRAENLNAAIQLLQQVDGYSVLPIIRYGFPIQRAFELKNNKIQFINPEHELTRSQDLEPRYHDAGQYYFINAHRFAIEKRLVSNDSYGIETPEMAAQDIDSLDDWKLAEIKWGKLIK